MFAAMIGNVDKEGLYSINGSGCLYKASIPFPFNGGNTSNDTNVPLAFLCDLLLSSGYFYLLTIGHTGKIIGVQS
jgi:hypothetical protein